eukprot:COSAG01_NODE_855_length_13088_cov_13.421511_7_plen_47_part_00
MCAAGVGPNAVPFAAAVFECLLTRHMQIIPWKGQEEKIYPFLYDFS